MSKGFIEGNAAVFMVGAGPVGIVCTCGRTMCRAYPTSTPPRFAWAIYCPNNHAEGCDEAAQMDKDVVDTVIQLNSR